MSVLSHEMFEAISDPDLNAWYNSAGNENADLCNAVQYPVPMNGTEYMIQIEYSNLRHTCVTLP